MICEIFTKASPTAKVECDSYGQAGIMFMCMNNSGKTANEKVRYLQNVNQITKIVADGEIVFEREK